MEFLRTLTTPSGTYAVGTVRSVNGADPDEHGDVDIWPEMQKMEAAGRIGFRPSAYVPEDSVQAAVDNLAVRTAKLEDGGSGGISTSQAAQIERNKKAIANLEKDVENKADVDGWTPKRIIGTDENGRLTETTLGDSGIGLPDSVKKALLACFAHTAWVDANGLAYYNDLAAALDEV